jgi:flavin reductase (DIM6/NTAB) family NADH-FMN oxidoreductase RutF
MSTIAPMDIDAAVANDFRAAMSLLASGVTVVTAGRGDERRGLTATAVCSLSMQPPSLLACVNRNGEAHAAIERENHFCVNILAQDDLAVSDRFAGRQTERGAEKFIAGEWIELETGSPVLKNALVAVDCEVYQTMRLETHTIFLGRVKAVMIGEKREPLLHFDRKYCSVA